MDDSAALRFKIMPLMVFKIFQKNDRWLKRGDLLWPGLEDGFQQGGELPALLPHRQGWK